MKQLLAYLKGESTGKVLSPKTLQAQKILKLFCVFAGGALMVFLLIHLSVKKSRTPKETPKKVVLDAALDAVSPKALWTNRLQAEAEKAIEAAHEAQKEARAAQNHQKILEKKVDVLEALFKSLEENKPLQTPETFLKEEKSGDLLPLKAAQTFPPQESFSSQNPNIRKQGLPKKAPSLQGLQEKSLQQMRPKILHLSLKAAPRKKPQTVDSYVTSGTYARGILLSGLAVSTSLSTQSNPQPIIIKLVDPGVIPNGFSSDIQGATLIGACHGDLSTERAFCRLNSMTLVEKNGEVLERKVEGWIFGEDGRPGLKGDVVDRAGDIARNAMMAGILSGMSKFLESQATSSIYPISPFGQTNALKGEKLLAGGAASGASNALEKLADFSIKRAEQMQPIILVSSGREVDVFFKAGVDLSDSTLKQELRLIGDPKRREHARNQAHAQGIQLQ